MKTKAPQLCFITFLFASGIFFTGCSDTIRAYHSGGIYMPLFRESKQVQADGELGGYSYQGRAAYSITNHFAVFGDYFYRSPLYNRQVDNYKDWNFGGEYFTQINDNITFEVLGGFGKGMADISNMPPNYGPIQFFLPPAYSGTSNLSSNYQRVLLQPNLGFHKRKINYGFGLRLSMLDFNKFNYNVNYYPQIDSTRRLGTINNQIFIMEPGLFMSKQFLSVNNFSADWFINAGAALPIGPKEPLPFSSVFIRAGIKLKLN